MPALRIAAALIVKDEQDNLPGCLESLQGLVDEVVVYDTGSGDATVEIAEGAGARVRRGFWDGDFARARNEALAMTSAAWVLSIDADERAVADPAALRALLATVDPAAVRPDGSSARPADVLAVRVRNEAAPDQGGSYLSTAPRLLRRAAVRWSGRVHELPARTDGSPAQVAACPPERLLLVHLGYTDPALLRAKSERNAELGRAELDRLLAGQPRDDARLAQVLLDLARSLVGSGQRQQAVDTLEVLRDLAPGSPQAVQGTDVLATVLLGAGYDELALALAAQLRQAGVDPRYCDWLEAQALAQLGRTAEALERLRRVDGLVDATGRHLDLGPVLEARALVASLAGEPVESTECLLRAMAGHGRVSGRGPLLASVWAARPVDDLGGVLAAAGLAPEPDRVAELVAELEAAPTPGPALARALRQLASAPAVA